MRIQSAFSGEGFVTKINKASNDIDVVLVVTYKDHKAGDLVNCGSEIVIVVSKG